MSRKPKLDEDGWPIEMPEPRPDQFALVTLVDSRSAEDRCCPLGWTWFAFRGNPRKGQACDFLVPLTQAERSWLRTLRSELRREARKYHPELPLGEGIDHLNDVWLSREQVARAWCRALDRRDYTEVVDA